MGNCLLCCEIKKQYAENQIENSSSQYTSCGDPTKTKLKQPRKISFDIKNKITKIYKEEQDLIPKTRSYTLDYDELSSSNNNNTKRDLDNWEIKLNSRKINKQFRNKKEGNNNLATSNFIRGIF